MIRVESLKDIAALRESVGLEVKLGVGQDGKGEIPRDFWCTYSAFANTVGGTILLGVRERDRTFSVQGIEDPEKLRRDLFNTLNSPAKVSCNLLDDAHVRVVEIDGKALLQVDVPAASRRQKPVYLNGNPLGNTYRRLHDGDRRCSDETVRRMIAEQVEDSRDLRILKGFDLADLDLETLRAYRQIFSVLRLGHPWATLDNREFLRVTGCWRKDRETGDEGLTLAGILMFGQWPAIVDAAPLYFLDYQELPAADNGETRWLDRVVPDGTWSGNLFDFFRKVSPKIMADLKTPFVLKGGIRQDDTPQHKALREALVNALVHADYSDRASVRIQKWPTGFAFRNPGTLRVPASHALRGGESDCRNRTLHQLFLQIGYGERAGSGLPRICEAWTPLGYKVTLADSFEPYDQTLLRIEQAGQPVPTLAAGIATCPPESAEARAAGTGQSSEKDAPVNAPANVGINAGVNAPVKGGAGGTSSTARSGQTSGESRGKIAKFARNPRISRQGPKHAASRRVNISTSPGEVAPANTPANVEINAPANVGINVRLNVGINVGINVPDSAFQTKLVEWIRANPRVTHEQLAVLAKKTPRTILRNLAQLKDKGRIARVGSRKNGHWEVL